MRGFPLVFSKNPKEKQEMAKRCLIDRSVGKSFKIVLECSIEWSVKMMGFPLVFSKKPKENQDKAKRFLIGCSFR